MLINKYLSQANNVVLAVKHVPHEVFWVSVRLWRNHSNLNIQNPSNPGCNEAAFYWKKEWSGFKSISAQLLCLAWLNSSSEICQLRWLLFAFFLIRSQSVGLWVDIAHSSWGYSLLDIISRSAFDSKCLLLSFAQSEVCHRQIIKNGVYCYHWATICLG